MPPHHTAIINITLPSLYTTLTYLEVLNESRKAAAACDKVHFRQGQCVVLLSIYKQEHSVQILGQYIGEKFRLLALCHQDI